MVASINNKRDPNTHATTHKSGQTDALKLSDLAVADNVTTKNTTTSYPGLCPKLSGTSTEFLNGAGAWTTPEGSGSGSSGITYPGSSTVFLNGNGAFSTPTASGSAFKPWITVGKTGSGADYVCDGTADDVQLQAAFTAVLEGGTVAILSGTYNLVNRVYASGKSFSVIGFGTVKLSFVTNSSNPVMQFAGSITDTETLSGNAAIGATTVILGSTANVQAGDLIVLKNSTVWSSGDSDLYTGETYAVESIDGTTVHLDQPLLRAYASSGSSAKIIRPVKISVKNIEITNQSATTGYYGLKYVYARDCEVHDCTFRSNGGAAICLYTTYGCDVANNNVYHSEMDGGGYGVLIADACAYINIHDNRIENCRHTISSGRGDTSYPLNRDITIDNNILVGSHVATGPYVVDAHRSTINYKVTNNYIFVPDSAVGFSDGTKNSIFSNNHIYGTPLSYAAYEKNGLIPGGRYILHGNKCYDLPLNRDSGATICESMQVIGNDVYNSSGTGISFISENYRQLMIANNVVEDADGEGIYVKLTSSAGAHSYVQVIGNNINSCGNNGIYVRNESSSYEIRAVVGNNIITKVDNSGTSCSGIHLYGVVGASVTGNTVRDDSAQMAAAIAEDNGCNNNVITGNVVGGGSSGVVVVGGNTVNANNVTV